MFYQNRYKKVHLIHYICLVSSLFLAPLLRAKSNAITQKEGEKWLEHAEKGEVKNMEKLIETNPNYLTWVDPKYKCTALIIASLNTRPKVVKMLLSKLSKKQANHLNIKGQIIKQIEPLNVVMLATYMLNEVQNDNRYDEFCSVIEPIIKTAKKYKIKLDLSRKMLDNFIEKGNLLMLVINFPELFKIAELLLDSYKEIGLDLNEKINISKKNIEKLKENIEKATGREKEDFLEQKKYIEKIQNGTVLTLLVRRYLELQEVTNGPIKNEKYATVAKHMKKIKEIIKKLLHLEVPLDEVSKSLAKQDKDLLQFMENEVNPYKFWRNLKIGGGIIGLLVLVASVIGGAYWFFVEKPKRVVTKRLSKKKGMLFIQ